MESNIKENNLPGEDISALFSSYLKAALDNNIKTAVFNPDTPSVLLTDAPKVSSEVVLRIDNSFMDTRITDPTANGTGEETFLLLPIKVKALFQCSVCPKPWFTSNGKMLILNDPNKVNSEYVVDFRALVYPIDCGRCLKKISGLRGTTNMQITDH